MLKGAVQNSCTVKIRSEIS